MSLFGDIGNFLGSLFNGDDQKKKQQQQQQTSQPAAFAMPRQPNTPAVGVQAPQPFLAGNQLTNAPPQIGGVKIQAPPTQFDGLSLDDTNTAHKIASTGGDPTKFIAAARQSNVAQNQSDYNNSFAGKVANFGENVGDQIIKPVLQAAPRLYNTFTSTDANNDASWVKDINSQLGYKPDDLQSTYKPDANGNVNPIMGTLGTVGDIAALIPAVGAGVKAATEATPVVTNTVSNLLRTLRPVAKVTERASDDTSLATNAARSIDEAGSINPTARPVETPTEPSQPITQSPTTNKAPAVTSANPDFQPPTVKPPVEYSPTPFDRPTQPPAISGVQPELQAAPRPAVEQPLSATPVKTADQVVADAQTAIDKAATEAPVQPEQAAAAPIESPQAAETRKLAEAATPPPQEAVQAIKDAEQSSAPVGKLGSITHDAVVDGSINTPEGVTKAIADTRTAANAEADVAGAKLQDIIRKGQAIWEKSNELKHDLTAKEVVEGYKNGKANFAGDPSFTPEQQAVYKNYMQEISTLRDRAGYSLDGGHQGAWYGPRQALTEAGDSAEFDSRMVNEISRNRNQSSGGIAGNMLDTSEAPVEHAIQRYANAPDAMSQQIVDRVQNNAKGEATGIKVPDAAREKLETALSDAVGKRDAAIKAAHEGDTSSVNGLKKQAEDTINKAFSNFIDDIPGAGSARRQAINDVKELRSTYRQSLMQVLSLSNVVNRVADQGGKAVALLKRPLEQGLNRVIDPIMQGKAMSGTDIIPTNMSKEASQAAKEIASGELGRKIGNNFKASMSLAGAGRNPIAKGVAKVAELPSALNSAATEAGDLATPNLRDALQLGASRPEAQGLKTVDDYRKYFGDYMQTDKFKQDLAAAEHHNNAQIGLSGGKADNMGSGGKISSTISRYGDNFVKNVVAPKLGIDPENVLVRNANDYVKGNITGYAGVGSRLLGYTKDAIVPFGKLKQAVTLAGSGAPNATAAATQMASKQIASSIAAYGSAAAAATALSSGPLKGVIGYTGPQPQSGSNDSSYNKDHSIPANQWYLNLPNGNRVYFNATRTFNAPGLIADTVAGAMTSKDAPSAAGNSLSQIYNQAGGSSVPNTVVDATKFINPSTTDAERKFAGQQLQATAAPSTGILNNFANWQDPTKRAPTNFVDDIKANVPGLRASVPAAKGSSGDPLVNSKQLSGGSSVFSVANNPDAPQTATADPLAAEVTRFHNAGIDVTPTNSNKNAKDGTTKDFGAMLLADPIYQNADDTAKAALLKGVLAGTSTKGINGSLNPTDKQALLDNKLLGAGAKVWREDNNNNFNYLTADVANRQANGTLTTADKDMGHKGSLAQQVATAGVNKDNNVSQDLISSYTDTKKADFNKLEDGSDEKNQLIAYDKALVAAGLPSKYQNKNGGYGTVAKAGAGVPKSFAFASLPSSLIGTGKSAGSGNGGYASDAPTFTPIASLKAPASVAIPNGRSISVSKGVRV